jgi:hypothetical protein
MMVFKVHRPLAGLIDATELYNLLADKLKFQGPIQEGPAKEQWQKDCAAVSELVEEGIARDRFLYFCGVIDGDELAKRSASSTSGDV